MVNGALFAACGGLFSFITTFRRAPIIPSYKRAYCLVVIVLRRRALLYT